WCFDVEKEREENIQQYVLFPLWSTGSKDPQNTDNDATFEVKEPESAVHVSPSSCNKTKKHDDKTKREEKGKSPVELSTGVRNLSEKIEDFSDHSINEVNAASTPVTTIEPNSTNSANTFSADDMLALEDITYSDDEEDVGAEADFSNLETTINISPIPTTRVHKDHPNRVLVTKPHNKTPYELLYGRLPSIGFMRPFGYPVTILNTLDPLGKFPGKVDGGFLVGYSVCSKAFRTMNYHPVLIEKQSNSTAGFQDTEKAGEKGTQTYVLFPVLSDGSTNPKNNKDAHIGGNEHNDDIQKYVSLDIYSSSCGDQAREQGDKAVNKDKGKSPVVTITGFRDLNEEFTECINNSSNVVSAAGPSVSAAGLEFTNSTNDFTNTGPLVSAAELNFTNNTNNFSVAGPSNAVVPNLEDLSHNADDVGAEADTNNMEFVISVSPIPTTKIHKDHPTSQIIGYLSSTTQTRSMARGVRDQGGISQMFNEDFHTCMFTYFLSQEEPKIIHQALKDPS
nr:ribonuclease H-like domain-containing protein [Tanacetum cinerariifolium]